MSFKLYDILATLIPGYLILFLIMYFGYYSFDKDLIVPYTAVSFLIGYINNAISSWLEPFYFFTWGGKPSNKILAGKIRFYDVIEIKNLLQSEISSSNSSNDHLFNIAMRYANNKKDNRVEDFNASYAFSRSLLTCMLIISFYVIYNNYDNRDSYVLTFPILVAIWYRSKQRGYYYAREVLNVYWKLKKSP